ncbi:MAG: hypothetical protein NZ841_02980 [Dictyoglomus sp.]|nr:hypothetical protein [Dictyoglomus sp.]MCX7942369.1 hypothetical protein [Dictyoglomaceae bacterium]MDW8188242.1 hypothetical protein [Dictyoglomus sp.]
MSSFLYIHLLIMILASILYLITSIIGILDRGDKRLNIHLYTGMITDILFILGFFHLIIENRLYPAFTHFYLAITFFVVLGIILLLGLIYKFMKVKNKFKIRKLHRFLSLFGVIFLILTLITGIRLIL